MNTLTSEEIKRDFSLVLNLIKNGEEIMINDAAGQGKIAVIIPYRKYEGQRKRRLGVLKGKARFKIKDDFKLTDEEFLSS